MPELVPAVPGSPSAGELEMWQNLYRYFYGDHGVILGNGRIARVADPICRAQGYCPTTRKCRCEDA